MASSDSWPDLRHERAREAAARRLPPWRVGLATAAAYSQLAVHLALALPLWALVPATRPSAKYSLRQALLVTVVRYISALTMRLRIAPAIDAPVAPASLQRSALLRPDVPPVAAERVVGLVRQAAVRVGVRPQAVRAYVFGGATGTTCAPDELRSLRRIVLALHGGAWVVGRAHEERGGSATAVTLAPLLSADVRVLNVEYRLAEENPFPAALLDALSAYVWLVEELQISPDRIVLSGDSGGANVALALIHYLRETELLPLPGKLLLASPAVDRTGSHSGPPGSRGDLLTPNDLAWALEAYLGYGRHPADLIQSPYVSPASKRNLSELEQASGSWPRTLICIGETEGYQPAQRALQEALARWQPQQVEPLLEVQGAPHCSCLIPTFFEPHTGTARQAMAAFVEA